jgi:hypothetical protein
MEMLKRWGKQVYRLEIKWLRLYLQKKNLKGTLTQKSVSDKHIGGCLRPSESAASIFTNCLIVSLKATIFNSIGLCRCKHLFFCGSRHANYFDTRCGA